MVMAIEKLVRMANQIAGFMASRPHEDAITGVAQHINDFWAPRMRQDLLDFAATDAAGLSDLVRAALPLIRPPPPPERATAAAGWE